MLRSLFQKVLISSRPLSATNPITATHAVRGIVVSHCSDYRIDKTVMRDIGKQVFGKLRDDRVFTHAVAGTMLAGDQSFSRLISTIDDVISAANTTEDFLLAVHDSCLAVQRGHVETKKDHDGNPDYHSSLEDRLIELMQCKKFVEMINKGNLNVKLALIKHNPDGSGHNQVEVYDIEFNQDNPIETKLKFVQEITQRFPEESKKFQEKNNKSIVDPTR